MVQMQPSECGEASGISRIPWLSGYGIRVGGKRNSPSLYKEQPVYTTLFKWSASICEGLVYLHEKGIVQGDLKGVNILVSSDGTPMLTDFGNASLGESTISFTGTSGSNFSLRWTAPEMLGESGTPSRAADVYALGMTILVNYI